METEIKNGLNAKILITDKEIQELINLLYNNNISQYGKRKIEKYIKEKIEEIKKLEIKLKAERAISKSALETLKECIHKDRIRKFIEENLPDDEIMKTCSMYDVNGIYIRKELERILGE